MFIPQEKLRLGLGILALVFYLWIIHSYKLAAGDIAVLLLGVGVFVRGGQLRVPGPLRVFALFIIWAGLGLMVTNNAAITFATLLELAKLWVIAFFIINVIRNAAELRFFAIAWLGVFALYPIRGALYNQYICQCTEFGRVAWNFVFDNPNDLAALCLIPLGIAAGVAQVERVKVWRWAAIAGVLVIALVVMLTQSRGAMLAMGVAAVLLPMTSKRRARDFALLLALMGSAALLAPRGVWERMAGLSNVSVQGGMVGVDPEGSAEARWQIWQIAGATVRDNPLLGVGVGMMPETHRFETLRRGFGYTVRGNRDTHSTYLRIAAEMGIPGALLYLAIWGSVLVDLRRVRKTLRNTRYGDHQVVLFLELSILAFLVASIFGTYGFLAFTYVAMAYAWLAGSILERESWYRPGRTAAAAGVPAPVMRRG